MAPVPPPLHQLVLAHMLIGYRNTCMVYSVKILFSLLRGSSTKSHRPQAEKEGGWVMAIFEKSPSI